jgi:hypothetical protein
MLNRRTFWEAVTTFGLATAFALFVFGPIWSAMDKPLAGGDLLASYVNSDNWAWLGYAPTTHYGFPDGMNLNYSPNIDLTENSFAHAVQLITGSPFLGLNLLLFLSFPIVATLAYLAIRYVGLKGPLAIALAVAFTMTPYHWGRGLGHLYLATIYGGVTGVLLALLISRGALARLKRPGRFAAKYGPLLIVAALIIVSAWSGLYYAAFGVLLTVAAVLWRIGKRDSWRSLLKATAVPASITLLALIGFLPGLITSQISPPTSTIAERSSFESVTFAGNLAMALTPAPISDLPGMWRYNSAVDTAFAPVTQAKPQLENASLTNFGVWTSSACAIVFIIGLFINARRPRRHQDRDLPFLAYLTSVVIVFFIPWGLNFFFATWVTAQVRAWNRLLPILLLLFILGAAASIKNVNWARNRVSSTIISAFILIIVLIDSVLPFKPAYESGAKEGELQWQIAATYAADVNAAVPGQCGILQLPYAVYPEQGQIERLDDYQHFWQPLVNREKNWSYGAVKNTAQSAFAQNLSPVPGPDDFALLIDRGFCGIHVDTRGMSDQLAQRTTTELEALLGKPVATGMDNEWQMYSLRQGQ